eukprot:scaffold1206_cov388-Prasinococcus_capsulatus_cf.AAC.5
MAGRWPVAIIARRAAARSETRRARRASDGRAGRTTARQASKRARARLAPTLAKERAGWLLRSLVHGVIIASCNGLDDRRPRGRSRAELTLCAEPRDAHKSNPLEPSAASLEDGAIFAAVVRPSPTVMDASLTHKGWPSPCSCAQGAAHKPSPTKLRAV